jgi:hypothetical protein
MKVYFTRDSVCAGDDGDAPHAREVELLDGLSVGQLVRGVLDAAGLPQISGGRATWCVSSGVPLAVVAQEWDEPRFVSPIPPRMEELEVSGGVVRMHFSYLAQQDPEVVYEVVRRLRFRAE